MTCDHCRKEIEGRAFSVGGRVYHGCCSCTVARKGPGMTGRDYPNEDNPERYDAAKSQALHIKRMEHGDYGEKNKIDSRTAERWKKVFVERAERIAWKESRVPEREIRPKAERIAHERAVAEDDQKRRESASELTLHKIDAQIRAGDLSP
jgi:hypothetical protein